MTHEQTLICIRCKHARFPGPEEQCYKFGGLICERFNTNVGKYDKCAEVRARLGIDPDDETGKVQDS
ncbi:MAG: hypothetical protein E3J72_19830 [Planctomycetota bacterium]|nr:MAG: hypothetical protein E3J72_19830 [Planctomycetota bacterium]